jgi:ferric-dicitrate binding protein FerR (iron transport regulator)
MDKYILYRFFDGSATDNETEQVRHWVESSSENRQAFFSERKMFDAILLMADTNRQQYKKHPVCRLQQKRTIRLRIPQMAAILTVVFALGMLAYPYLKLGKEPATAWYETVAPLGAKSQITLIDGTKVWLNAGSKLLYSTQFGQNNRHVQLEGEAYFEVAKNKLLLFEVKTPKICIKALGTSFNVKAYPNEETVETILVEGEVEVSRTDGAGLDVNDLILQPKQRLTFVKKTNELLVETKPQEISREKTAHTEPVAQDKVITSKIKKIEATTDYMIHTSWKDDRWRIESEELGKFATKLERRYNVKIWFVDKELPKYKFNGAFANEPIEEVLRALALAAPVNFLLKGNEVTLSRNDKFEKKHKSLYEVK